MLKAGVHSNKELQDLYNTYGAATIHFEIVDRSEQQFHAEKLKEIQKELKAKSSNFIQVAKTSLSLIRDKDVLFKLTINRLKTDSLNQEEAC